jgi:NADH:ubiquinone oxidoreductase subunit 2 (subunit N)
MQLLILLVVGGLGAVVSGVGLARGGRAARVGAVAGGSALLLMLVLALTLDPPAAVEAGIDPGFATQTTGGLFDGRLVSTAYLRLVLGLWALDAVLLAGIAWLLGGLAHLRGVLPATLAAMTGGVVVLASADLAIGAAAATATGLAAIIAVPPGRSRTVAAAAARELRLTLLVGAAVLAVVAVAPLTAALALRGAGEGGGALTTAVTAVGAGAMLGLGALAIAVAVGARLGAIPFHVRFSRIADVASPIDLPLLLAWLAVPVAVVGLVIVDGLIAPLALPFAGNRLIIVALAFVTLVAAAIAAYIQDDLRHATGYLVIADGGLVLLGFAALDPAAWGPARVWLVAMAASKTALAAWSAVAEDRFETRSIPDLRGWLRRSPILAAGLVVTVIATFGVPGWIAYEARGTLARLAVDAPWDVLLVLAGFLTLPTYLRLLALGVGPATSKVDCAAPERIVRRRGEGVSLLRESLKVEVEGAAGPSGAGDVSTVPATSRRSPGARSRAELMASAADGWDAVAKAGIRFGGFLRRDRTELLAAWVLALAVLAALTSWGALDLAGAAAEPAPIVPTAVGD